MLVVIASIVAWRWTISRARAAEREQFRLNEQEQRIIERSRAALNAIPLTPAKQLIQHPQQLAEAVNAIEVNDPGPGTPQIVPPIDAEEIALARDALHTLTRDFIARRLLDPDVDRYTAWRQSRGDVLRPVDDELFQMPAVYKIWVGEPMPPGMSGEQAFRAIYSKFNAQDRPAARVTAIGLGPDALVMRVWWEHPHIMHERPRYEQLIGLDEWVQTQYSAMGSWFVGVYDDPDFYTAMRVHLHAMVGFLARYADGSRHPVVLLLHWEPKSKHWMFDHITYSDTPVTDDNRIIY